MLDLPHLCSPTNTIKASDFHFGLNNDVTNQGLNKWPCDIKKMVIGLELFLAAVTVTANR